MTFTLIARCPRTGAFGIATATGEMAVGSRVPFARAGVGAVATQALTNPTLGPRGLGMLAAGRDAASVLEALVASDGHIERRQVAVVDAAGRCAVRTGAGNMDWKGHHAGDGFVAMGNKLVSERVVADMAAAFAASPAESLPERLCRALEAGRDAGGQPDGQQSVAMLVHDDRSFPAVDLRVDRHAEPVGELRAILDAYMPLIPYYKARADDPSVGPWNEWLARQQQQAER